MECKQLSPICYSIGNEIPFQLPAFYFFFMFPVKSHWFYLHTSTRLFIIHTWISGALLRSLFCIAKTFHSHCECHILYRSPSYFLFFDRRLLLILLSVSYACWISIKRSCASRFLDSSFTLSGWFSLDSARQADVISVWDAVGSTPRICNQEDNLLIIIEVFVANFRSISAECIPYMNFVHHLYPSNRQFVSTFHTIHDAVQIAMYHSSTSLARSTTVWIGNDG